MELPGLLHDYIFGKHLLQGLRILDPSGVVLEKVCDPVRSYLRIRDDTVRCIVASLTDDSSNELADVSHAHVIV